MNSVTFRIIIAMQADSPAPPSPTSSKIKDMRRIAERTQAPTDKTELISYLSARISQAEDALNDTEQLLESQVKQRQKIAQLIEQRNQQLQKLYEVDQRGLPEKIREKLTEILTSTVNQKVEAEEHLFDERSRNYQFKQMYDELKWEEKNINHRLTEQKTKEDGLNTDIGKLETDNAKMEEELAKEQEAFGVLKGKKEALENKYLQMKVALERMGDLKAVLNRFFGNEDLFDERMELKEQRIQRVEVISRENQPRVPSRENKTQPKLKPINYSTKNDDEDFWRGDFSKAKH